MKKITTLITCILIILACFGAMIYIIWQIKLVPPCSTIQTIGCLLMFSFPSFLIYLTLAGLIENLKE